jgi:hypothetical protein
MSEKSYFTWSPVTESNRRPSPYHSCLFHPPGSLQVRLSQVAGILVSECVAFGLLLSVAVVTWFVTGCRTISGSVLLRKSWVRLIAGPGHSSCSEGIFVASVYIADRQSDRSKASGSAIANEDTSILIYCGEARVQEKSAMRKRR